MNPETKIQNDIRVALSAAGCVIIRTNTGTVRTKDGRMFTAGPPNGWPDLTGAVKETGQIILIEVKTPKGNLRPDQKKMAKIITSMIPNAIYGVARSAEDAIEILKKGVDHDRRRMEKYSKL